MKTRAMRIRERQQKNTVYYHAKAIVKIMVFNFITFMEWGSGWLQVFFDKVEEWHINRMRKRIEKYDKAKRYEN